ncbi:putative glycoside hydrolase family 16 protein [Botrytis fragariae]|uniref:chitinase n=1 Tax=Botrytis fragariae TaxID=1964551 RepID=A0A8H6AVC0_9HELO|nr:putative glycoside hydrolase family 16 protein [Botrytis fragariae]KAF5874281.1 putative glycoside hydrolase family 16 protein [Botrytis fragariae]
MFPKLLLTAATALLSAKSTFAQTYSSCNPLFTTGCPANTALGKSIDVDFTSGSVNSFTGSGDITYDSNGASFTVSESGDAPTLSSIFYIMFGKVQITMKAAPGAGIVSTLVLQSDDLDEIDMEWLGADDTEVQTNYFGKGKVTDYNRGAFNPAANNQGEFITYTIEWTSEQVVWSVGSTVVRVLTPATADSDQYPQSPMQIKFGAWSGGDSSNAAGTISWARGPTDYSNGPFSMVVQSIDVSDYSTGTQYKYGDQSGDWTSIEAIGGSVNGNEPASASSIQTAGAAAVTSSSPTIPAGINNGNSATRTGYPWVAGTQTVSEVTWSTGPSIPSGWEISSEGKIVPTSAGSTPSSYVDPSPSFSSPLSGDGLETITGWDSRGFAVTSTIFVGCSTAKSYDQQGFLVTGIAACTTGADQGGLGTNAAGAIGGKVRSTNKAGNDHNALPTVLGIVAAAVGGLWI